MRVRTTETIKSGAWSANVAGRYARVVTAIALVGVLTTGCMKPLKNKVALLERENSGYRSQLESARVQIDDVVRERDSLGERLQLTQQELDNLGAQLVADRQTIERTEAPDGWTSVPGGVMTTIDDGVLFAVGKADLRRQAAKVLDRVVVALNGSFADKQVLVFGHTDDQPIRKSGWKDNWQLSAERALAVVRYLRDRGVNPERLVAGGCGEYRPRNPNGSNKSRAANRRVEIFAVDRQVATTGR